jgi:hypothetical protein
MCSMTIYLHHDNISKEKLPTIEAFFKKLGYDNYGYEHHEFRHSYLRVNPIVNILDTQTQIGHLTDCIGVQRVLDFLVRELQPTHWNTDLEVFMSDAESHYRLKKNIKIDLPYVPMKAPLDESQLIN